jgi:hypothetical protein
LGSTRWGARSLEVNLEINLAFFDVNLNAKLMELFTVKRQNAVPIIESEINSFLSSKKSETIFVVYFYFIFSGGGTLTISMLDNVKGNSRIKYIVSRLRLLVRT